MQEERCEECGSKVVPGLVCDCPPDRTAVKVHRQDVPGTQEWRPQVPDTILISPTGYAHVSDECMHLTKEYVKAPRWGMIPNPPPGLWDSLSGSNPARATEGNTERVAVKRCTFCDTTLMPT